MTIPAWLLRHREGAFRAARLHPCPRCRRPILSGLDDDIAARPVHADPTPINALGEAIALLSGRATYNLRSLGRRKELDHRYPWNVEAPRRYPVLPEHRCGQPLDAHAEPVRPEPRYVIPAEPPF